jgi:hypothetical protein
MLELTFLAERFKWPLAPDDCAAALHTTLRLRLDAHLFRNLAHKL